MAWQSPFWLQVLRQHSELHLHIEPPRFSLLVPGSLLSEPSGQTPFRELAWRLWRRLRRCAAARSSASSSMSPGRKIHTKASLYESRPPKQGGSSSVSNGTTLQSTAVGLIWQSLNLASYRPSASTAGFPTNKSSSRKSPPGSTSAMPTTIQSQLASQPNARTQTQAPFTFNLIEFGRLASLPDSAAGQDAVLPGRLQPRADLVRGFAR